ncbi:MAG: hypothetical protein DMF98_02360 [Acidobacteria bacterium]|nr:MAG: hypothetical protein DMF98_02360 [Acidobacteriota bacterium]
MLAAGLGSAEAATFDELVHRPIPLRTGIGSAHDAVSTSSKQAQAWYDQGLAYLHSYVWIEAARSFNQALRIDPALAMAHIGLTCAYIELNAPAAARSALDEARSLAGSASDHDRAHIAARALQMDAEAARHASQRLIDYRAALDAALAKFPDDEELWLLRGHAESSDPAERGQGSGAAAVHFYESEGACAGACERASLPHPRVREHGPNRRSADRGGAVRQDGAGHPARAAHVRPRAAARGQDGRSD